MQKFVWWNKSMIRKTVMTISLLWKLKKIQSYQISKCDTTKKNKMPTRLKHLKCDKTQKIILW